MNKLKVKSKHLVLGLLMVVFGSYSAMANNIQVSNVSIVGQNTTDHYSMIKFDVSWDNSWRVTSAPSNFDAAWVFIKYRLKSSSVWNHATLHYNGHTSPTGGSLYGAQDVEIPATSATFYSYGEMLFSSSLLTQGAVNYTDIELRWDYGIDGLVDTNTVEIAVCAIEMVYINTGSFYVGSGGSESSAFYTNPNTSTPYQITSDDYIQMFQNSGYLNYAGQTLDLLIEPNYPEGYYGFFCMKYEISQGQYTDFLNKLTPTQASNRFPNHNGDNRNSIAVPTGGLVAYLTTSEDVACNYLSWLDVTAYLDWAALRPMSELEYEKVCRGPLASYPDENVWGNANINTTEYSLNNLGNASEGVQTNFDVDSGNVAYDVTVPSSVDGPLRCGAFAANSANINRQTAGATYYGVMEMSGNVAEFVVSVISVYRGEKGDGILNSNGEANQTYWPTTSGFGTKGGSWFESASRLKISDRNKVNIAVTGRYKTNGGRGVR